MTGLSTLTGRAMMRASAGVLMAVAMTVLTGFLGPTAPVAWADPAADADVAITQAWDAGGGPTGPLGVKDGGVYPVGAGFGQNFAGGKIYFTPDTGARIMRGAILDKYLALGGPADGDLGFPNIDEGDGRAPNSRNTTFSAADNPVIFWTPDTGARVVRGAINAAWDKLGGSAGVLGVPKDDEVFRGDVVTQDFTGGQVSWNRKTGAFTTTPPELADQLAGLPIPGDVTTAINMARRAAGGPMGPLGAKDGEQFDVPPDGVGQKYAGGTIFYSPATGANVVTGQILAKYESVGGPQGDLGLPTSSEGDGGLNPSSVVSFAAEDQPVIFWTPDFGAVIVRGAMNAAWTKLGGATGELGAPTADQAENGNVITQKFSGGAISYDKATNEFSTEPVGLASQLAGLEVPGAAADVPQAPPADDGQGPGGNKWYQWQQWWLLAIIPVAVLLIAIVVGVLLNRRRHEDREPLDRFDDDYDDHDEHDDDEFQEVGRFHGTDEGHPDDGHGYDSGPLPRVASGEASPLEPASMWAMPVDRGTSAPGTSASSAPGAAAPTASPLTGFHEDEDAIDTAPTRIESEADEARIAEPDDRHDDSYDGDDEYGDYQDDGDDYDDDDDYDNDDFDEYADESLGDKRDDATGERDDATGEREDEPVSGPPSGRHAAIQLDEPSPAQTSFRLAVGTPTAPDGYPIKADTKSGLYWTPGSAQYDRAPAEIWFASEEFALTNGFVKG